MNNNNSVRNSQDKPISKNDVYSKFKKKSSS